MKLPGKSNAPAPSLLAQRHMALPCHTETEWASVSSSRPAQQRLSGTNPEHKEGINPQRMQCANTLDKSLSN